MISHLSLAKLYIIQLKCETPEVHFDYSAFSTLKLHTQQKIPEKLCVSYSSSKEDVMDLRHEKSEY